MATALIGLAGVVLGALLSAVGFYLRTSLENRRIINNVVFNLLGVWAITRLMDKRTIDHFSKEYLEQVQNRLKGAVPSREQGEELKTQIQIAWGHLGLRIYHPRKTRLVENYAGAVRQLASIDPVLAFELDGNETFQDRLTVLDEYFGSLDLARLDPTTDPEVSRELFDRLRDIALDDALRELERDIARTALHGGLVSWIKCKRKLSQVKNKQTRNMTKEVNRFLDRILVKV